MFRRACFNVFAKNRDDHTKNFAFVMARDGSWQPSPAYDLSFTEGRNAEHMLLVGNRGRDPTREDLEALAKEVGLKRASQIIDQVQTAVAAFPKFADQAGLSAKETSRIADALGAAPPKTKRPRPKGTRRASTRKRR
jgi:serine/threonine-protein kinase HipA